MAPVILGRKLFFKVLLAISFCHLLNDTVQSLLPAIYPLLRDTFRLDFGQIGLISFTTTFTASLLQPLVGLYSDRHHRPNFLAIGMGITLIGLVTLSLAPSYGPFWWRRGWWASALPFFIRSLRGWRDGFGWAARDGAIAVSGWRERGIGARAVAGDIYFASRAAKHCVVFLCGAAGNNLLADIGAWTKRRRAALAELQVAPPLAGHVVAAASVEPHLQLKRKKIFGRWQFWWR